MKAKAFKGDVTDAAGFRRPMQVLLVRVFPECPERFSFPICPRCTCTMEREYQAFCDRCGQALDWTAFSKAQVIRTLQAYKSEHLG